MDIFFVIVGFISFFIMLFIFVEVDLQKSLIPLSILIVCIIGLLILYLQTPIIKEEITFSNQITERDLLIKFSSVMKIKKVIKDFPYSVVLDDYHYEVSPYKGE